MRTIEFEGHMIEYDERCIKSYKWQKALNSGDNVRSTWAISRLFFGRDDEYADLLSSNDTSDADDLEELDDSMELMAKLVVAVMEDMGQTGKN